MTNVMFCVYEYHDYFTPYKVFLLNNSKKSQFTIIKLNLKPFITILLGFNATLITFVIVLYCTHHHITPSFHPWYPMIASGSGQRHFTIPDSEDEDEDEIEIIDNSIKLWLINRN